MAPRFLAIMCLPKERLHQKTPLRLTSLTFSQSSSGYLFRRRSGASDAGISDEDIGRAVTSNDFVRRLFDLGPVSSRP